MPDANGDSFSPLAAAVFEDFSTADGGTSFSEAVDAGAVNFAGLKSALHKNAFPPEADRPLAEMS